jgi:hypothetical protein
VNKNGFCPDCEADRQRDDFNIETEHQYNQIAEQSEDNDYSDDPFAMCEPMPPKNAKKPMRPYQK